jgi:hypothetical protein
MRVRDRSLSFETITCHRRVTQCLGALGDAHWYMAGTATHTYRIPAPHAPWLHKTVPV